MTITNFSLALTLAIAFTSCSFIRNSVSIKEKERGISSVNNNVCKRLRGDVGSGTKPVELNKKY
jgi:hypothetical protein